MSATGVSAVAGDESATIADFLIGYEQGAAYAIRASRWKRRIPIPLMMCRQASGAHRVWQLQACGYHIPGSGQIRQRCIFAAAKAGGFYAIGVDQDQKLSAKEYDDVIICSVVKSR